MFLGKHSTFEFDTQVQKSRGLQNLRCRGQYLHLYQIHAQWSALIEVSMARNTHGEEKHNHPYSAANSMNLFLHRASGKHYLDLQLTPSNDLLCLHIKELFQ